jgi:hypothetical protein
MPSILEMIRVNHPNDPWNFFDRFYCISLREREDRRRSAQAEFLKVGLAERVEFVIVDRCSNDFEREVYESHMMCLREGLEAGAHHIVIFEDDVTFDRFDPERLRSCTEFLKEHPQWKVFLLGALLRSSSKTANPSVQKVRYQSLTHAYALNRHYAEALADEPWSGIVNDTLFRPLKDDIYAIRPMCAFQKNFTSDNYKYPKLAFFRNLLGGLKNIQMGMEFYQQHKIGIIIVHAVLVLLILMALFLS